MKKKRSAKKLALFDIDGTLIRHVKTSGMSGLQRFPLSIKAVYGVDVVVDPENWTYNGMIDRGIAWDLVRKKGVSNEEFVRKLPELGKKFSEFLDQAARTQKLYEPIAEARELVHKVMAADHVDRGVLTGNLEHGGWWKLAHTGFEGYFEFGLFGNEAEDRISLAKMVHARAKKAFGRTYRPTDVVIIGDTVHDIRCAKAIEATVIAVTTGFDADRGKLEQEKPDLLVDSLKDERVAKLLALS